MSDLFRHMFSVNAHLYAENTDDKPRTPKREKPQKRGKRGKRQSIGDEDFGQSALLDDELRGNVNARTIAAASMEMARSNPTQEGRQQRV